MEQVRILDGQEELAVHPRCFDKGQQIENQAHINALIDRKRKARKYRGQDRLIKAVPQCRDLLDGAALRGDNLGSITSTLLRLLDRYGVSELTIAIDEALKNEVPHPNAVRQTLQKRREERLKPPSVPVPLPDDEKVRDIDVKPHALDDYDQLGQQQKHSMMNDTQDNTKDDIALDFEQSRGDKKG